MIKWNSKLCQNINLVNMNLFYFGRAQVDKKWSGKVQNPVYSRLFYIVDGTGCIKWGHGQELNFEADSWYLLPAGCSFEYSCPEYLDHVYFNFKLCDADGLDLLRQSPFPCSIKLNENKSEFFINALDASTVVEGLRVRHEIYEVVLSIIEEYDIKLRDTEVSLCIKKATQYIKHNLNVQLTTPEIAKHAFVSPSTVTKHFKSELNMTVHDYIYDVVLTEAAYLLIKSNLSILKISEKFGFCDQFYFSRRFREKFGVSPREYRKTTTL